MDEVTSITLFMAWAINRHRTYLCRGKAAARHEHFVNYSTCIFLAPPPTPPRITGREGEPSRWGWSSQNVFPLRRLFFVFQRYISIVVLKRNRAWHVARTDIEGRTKNLLTWVYRWNGGQPPNTWANHVSNLVGFTWIRVTHSGE